MINGKPRKYICRHYLQNTKKLLINKFPPKYRILSLQGGCRYYQPISVVELQRCSISKMNSLVADYGTDEETSSHSDEDNQKTLVQLGDDGPEKSSLGQESGDGKNYLISQDASSDSDEETNKPTESKEGDKSVSRLPTPLLEKLPRPPLDTAESSVHGSVFVNKFDKAEQAKQSILERHVKMTENENVKGKNVKICWKFRKGRCPFGKNCKYSHDLDSNLSLKYQQKEETDQSATEAATGSRGSRPPQKNQMGFMGTMETFRSHSTTRVNTYPGRDVVLEEEVDDDNYMASAKRKKRSGVSEHLLPPKKAMAALQRQREEERPWTVNK